MTTLLQNSNGDICAKCGNYYFHQYLVRSSCGHLFCTSCIRSIFTDSISGKQHGNNNVLNFPPECPVGFCFFQIPFETVALQLTAKHMLDYNRMARFFGALRPVQAGKQRLKEIRGVYCWRCGLYHTEAAVAMQSHSVSLRCEHCEAHTCKNCLSRVHAGDCILRASGYQPAGLSFHTPRHMITDARGPTVSRPREDRNHEFTGNSSQPKTPPTQPSRAQNASISSPTSSILQAVSHSEHSPPPPLTDSEMLARFESCNSRGRHRIGPERITGARWRCCACHLANLSYAFQCADCSGFFCGWCQSRGV